MEGDGLYRIKKTTTDARPLWFMKWSVRVLQEPVALWTAEKELAATFARGVQHATLIELRRRGIDISLEPVAREGERHGA